MKHPITNNLRSHNNEVSRFNKNSMKSHRNHPQFLYEGGIELYEDAADYIDVRRLTRGVRIA